MVDVAKATKILEDYFASVTKEQFSNDLRKFCPELFEEEEGASNDSKNSSIENHQPKQEERQMDTTSHHEIYLKARQDSKIEIAGRLLQKGLGIEEVAEILELDINTIYAI